ncbi:enoyl-CoA hydratase/isomerase family protein [Kordiimonas pumila]|uniref:Enoyl-CoA hydratase/isomerase family protein n=1 Tax=Kordiimonas pumila TaxID=2161677 RepID=A0ABV7D7C0_9PROT|nr:enoyl-CoA hydratase-related protein [Kordiimonas pumila]
MDIHDKTSLVYIDKEGSIGKLVLNRAAKRNALKEAMWRAIPEAVKALDADPHVRVILVVSASDTVFAAGADIEELQVAATNPDRQESNRLAIREAQRSLARAEKPTIACIQGACVGGGCGIAIHCDFRFASDTARLGITPAKLGIVYPLNDTKQLIDLVGSSKAKSLLFTGRILDAEEALSIGLIDQLIPSTCYNAAVLEFASELARVSQYSIRHMKKNVQRVLDGQVDDCAETAAIFRECQLQEDAVEGIKAFLEKRPADFKWNG